MDHETNIICHDPIGRISSTNKTRFVMDQTFFAGPVNRQTVIVSSLPSEVSGMPGREGIGFEKMMVAGFYSKGVSSTVVEQNVCLYPIVKIGFFHTLPKK